jgi:hypothetical protein
VGATSLSEPPAELPTPGTKPGERRSARPQTPASTGSAALHGTGREGRSTKTTRHRDVVRNAKGLGGRGASSASLLPRAPKPISSAPRRAGNPRGTAEVSARPSSLASYITEDARDARARGEGGPCSRPADCRASACPATIHRKRVARDGARHSNARLGEWRRCRPDLSEDSVRQGPDTGAKARARFSRRERDRGKSYPRGERCPATPCHSGAASVRGEVRTRLPITPARGTCALLKASYEAEAQAEDPLLHEEREHSTGPSKWRGGGGGGGTPKTPARSRGRPRSERWVPAYRIPNNHRSPSRPGVSARHRAGWAAFRNLAFNLPERRLRFRRASNRYATADGRRWALRNPPERLAKRRGRGPVHTRARL